MFVCFVIKTISDQIPDDVPGAAGGPVVVPADLPPHGPHGGEDEGGHGLPPKHGLQHRRHPQIQERGSSSDPKIVHRGQVLRQSVRRLLPSGKNYDV